MWFVRKVYKYNFRFILFVVEYIRIFFVNKMNVFSFMRIDLFYRLIKSVVKCRRICREDSDVKEVIMNLVVFIVYNCWLLIDKEVG